MPKIKISFDERLFLHNSDKILEAADRTLDDLFDYIADRATSILDSGIFHGKGFLKKSQDLIKNPLHKIIEYFRPSESGGNVAVWVEYGTGIYGTGEGASKQPIRPKEKKALKWKSRSGNNVFAKVVRGMKPRPFLRPAFDEGVLHLQEFWENNLRHL